MKTRKIYLGLLIAVLIASLILCGTVIAYMFRQTEYKDNKLTPANVSCEILETVTNNEKTSIQIKNTGNIDAYLRVRLVSYWVDADGNIVAKPSPELSITLAEGWITGSNNTYYYKRPVAPGTPTPNLLKDGTSIYLEQDENGYLQVIEVFAEAIQSEPKKAVTSAWNVTLDDNGNITAAP